MDSSTTTFDNVYYKLLLQGISLFSSDQALLSTRETKTLVSKFASSQEMFEKAFVKSMIKMSSISGGQEIRLDCKVVR
jgi:peroxidase